MKRFHNLQFLKSSSEFLRQMANMSLVELNDLPVLRYCGKADF